uniref:DUF2341 domain-containing protein n=1 Tax=Methanococcus maripaludis (strain C6 / ATCC BAA-1332) TaxID=444158 RepID=A9A856_METM6
MYLSHTTITLVLLMMLTATMIYNTIDLQKDQIITETIATAVDLKSSSLEHVVETSIPTAFNKVLNDMELEVIQSGDFYENESEVITDLENRLDSEMNGNLESIKNEYSDYDMDYDFEVTNITMIDGFTFKVDYDLEYSIAKENVYDSKNVSESQEITVKTIVSAYHYLASSENTIKIENPNNYALTDYQVKVILDSSNFNFTENNNGLYIEFFDNDSDSVDYWIEYWNASSEQAIVWLEANLTADSISEFTINSSGTGTSSGADVFLLFDGFEDSTIFANISGTWGYDTLNNDFYNVNLSNEKMRKCENSLIVSRIISINSLEDLDSSVTNYIVEVDAKGENSDYDSPHVMLGYFAGLSGDDVPLHTDEFYTLELGGLYKSGDLFKVNKDSGAFETYYVATNADILQIVNEYGRRQNDNKRYIDRHLELQGTSEITEKTVWYRLKVKLDQDTGDIYGTYSTIPDYVLANGGIAGYAGSWDITTTVSPYGSYFELGTSSGYPEGVQDMYFDNFRVRKSADVEPEQIIQSSGIYYISPPRAYGTSYGTEGTENSYFEESDDGLSIIEMLANADTHDPAYGYGIKLVEN